MACPFNLALGLILRKGQKSREATTEIHTRAALEGQSVRENILRSSLEIKRYTHLDQLDSLLNR